MRREEAISTLSKRSQKQELGKGGRRVRVYERWNEEKDGGKEEKETGRESSPWLSEFFAGGNTGGKWYGHGSGARESLLQNDRLVNFPPTVTPKYVGLPADPRCPNDSVCSGWRLVDREQYLTVARLRY